MPKISNAEFLKAISKPSEGLNKEQNTEAELWICSKESNSGTWYGNPYKVGSSKAENSKLNNYFCVSRLKPFDGVLARRNSNFLCLMCVVLDDVGTNKAKRPDLEPSWKIETSPSNEQWGYILETPITDSEEAENLINLVIKAKYCDKGANGHVRYMRLPVGSNDKPEHVKNNNGKPYTHKLKAWNPDSRYTKQQLIEDLGLDKFVNHEQAKIKKSGVIIDETNAESDEELIKNIITGENYHASTRNLAARYVGREMKEKGIIFTIQGFMLTSAVKDERWQERYNDVPRLVKTAVEKFSPDEESQKRFTLIPASDFVKTTSISWIVKHILPAGGLAMIYGASGTGKSFFALDLTASISRGIFWCGKKVKQGKIAYIAAEGVNGFRRRIKAYCEQHNIMPDDLLLKIIAETPDLTRDHDKALIASIKEDGGTDVVVIDTLAQVSAGANENSAEDMGMVLKRCQNIQKETGALVLLIHHSGKDDARGERGWSGIRAAMDTVIKITSNKSGKVATLEKQKDGDDSFKVHFHLKQFELGLDEDNEAITSCIVELENPSFSPIKEPELKGDIQRIILEILKERVESEKEFLIREVIKRSDPSAKNRRDSSVLRTLNNMLKSSILQENQGLIRITQQHNTAQNSTCADVVKSES